MNTSQIIALVLSSTVLSASITLFITWRFKIMDFKNEYLKILIKRRLDAYDFVEIFLGGFNLTMSNDGIDRQYYCLSDKDTYANVLIKDLGIALKFSRWLSDETIDIVKQFRDFAFQYTQIILSDNISQDEINVEALASYKQVHTMKNQLENSLKKDYKVLHKFI